MSRVAGVLSAAVAVVVVLSAAASAVVVATVAAPAAQARSAPTTPLLRPAASGDAPSSWRGWTSAAGSATAGGVADVAETGDTTLTVGPGTFRRGVVTFRVQSPSGVRTGAVSASTDPPGRFPDGGTDSNTLFGPRPVVLAPDLLLVLGSCEIRRSVDGGATWTDGSPPGCGPGEGTLVVSFSDRDHGFALRGDATWTTSDGAATWTRRSGGGPPRANPNGLPELLALSPEVALRTADDPAATTSAIGADGKPFTVPGPRLQRTDDAGATWTDVPVPVSDADLAAAEAIDGRRGLGLLVRRADGTILLRAGGGVLSSADGGRTFTDHRVPSLLATLTASSVVVDGLACDAAARCVVDVFGRDRSQGAVRFEGAAYGAELGPLPPPRYPGDTGVALGGLSSPRPGVLLARRGLTLGTSTDLGATWTTVGADRPGGPVQVGTPAAPVLSTASGLAVSSDRARTFRTLPPPPGAGELRRVLFVGGTALAVRAEGTVSRFRGGRWRVVSRLRGVRPQDAALADGAVLVVGLRRVVRLTGGLRSGRPDVRRVVGVGLPSWVRARGRTVVAGTTTPTVRSSDGGRTWRRIRRAPGTDDVQIVGPRSIVALDEEDVLRSRDGGRTFRRVGRALPLDAGRFGSPGYDEAESPPAVAFATPRRGLLLTASGLFRTTDGGRTLTPVPTPPNGIPGVAVPVGAGPGLVASDGWSTTLYRSDGRTAVVAVPRLRVRREGRPGPPPRYPDTTGVDRSQVVRGTVSGVPAGTRVVLATQRTRGGPPRGVLGAATVDGRSAFRTTVELRRGDRVLRAWFLGLVLPDRTIPAASSRPIAAPARRR